ncbi:PPE domain-containing protein [Amycolatopsis magusensis]|uniref:PPE domain-containing protein n=1 Tax=Amycolatopsis magusensis TaxID=882444 RepID=UPI0037910D92
MNDDQPDPADLALTQTQNWRSRSHRELYESVHLNNDPGQVGQLGQEWTGIGAEMSEHSRRMGERIRSTESGWRGNGADSARESVLELVQWSGNAATTAEEVGRRIGEQGRIMENARSAMPEPVEFDWQAMVTNGFATGGLAGFAAAVQDVRVKSDQANAAHEQAVTVMSQMETASREVDSGTPRFVAPVTKATPMMAASRSMNSIENMDAAGGGAGGGAGAPGGPGSQQDVLQRAQQGTSPLQPFQTAQPLADTTTTAGFTGPGGPGGSPQMPGMPNVGAPAAAGLPGGGPGGGPGAPGMPPLPGGMPGGGGPGGAGFSPNSMPRQDTTRAQNAPSFTMPNTPGGGAPDMGTNPSGFRGGTPPQSTPPNFSMPNLPGGKTGGGGGVEDTIRQNRYQPPPKMPDYQGPGGTQYGGGTGPNPGAGGPNRPGVTPPQVPRFSMPPGPGVGGMGGFGGGGGGAAGGFGPGSGGAGGGAAGFGPGGGGSGAAGGGYGPQGPGASTGAGAGAGRMPAEGFGPRGTAAGAGAAGMGGAMGGGMGAAGGRGQGEEDKERRSAAYIQGEEIFQVPGEDLPPPVIGARKQKKPEQP